MAKKKKNNNYVTEKRETAKREAARARKMRSIKKGASVACIAVGILAALTAVILLLGTLFGWWEEKPVATSHAVIAVENYGSLHVELYGNNAPQTVSAFLKLVNEGKYNGLTLDKLLGGKLETGAVNSTATIKGEFSKNGFKNIVKHEKGVLSMAHGEGNDSANGEFFIVTEKNKSLDGKYAAFGKITDTSILDQILKDLTPDENGNIPADKQPKITSISVHAHH